MDGEGKSMWKTIGKELGWLGIILCITDIVCEIFTEIDSGELLISGEYAKFRCLFCCDIRDNIRAYK